MKTTEFLKENEFIAHDADQMHQTHQHSMLREECYHLAVNAVALHQLLGQLPEGEELAAWAAEYISLANDHVKSVKEFLEYSEMEQDHGMPEFDPAMADAVIAESLGAEGDSAEKDMTGETCEKCKKGKYQETSQNDDMDGVLHCTKCNKQVDRWRSYKAEGRVGDVVKGVKRIAKGKTDPQAAVAHRSNEYFNAFNTGDKDAIRKTERNLDRVNKVLHGKFSEQGVAEGSEERGQNALWAQITDYEKRAKATKNNIKKAHYMKMADQLRSKLNMGS
jgi:hypothetical protein